MRERVDDLLAQAGDNRCKQAVLVTEVGIHGSFGTTDAGDDCIHAHPGISLFQEHFRRRRENRLPLFGLPLTFHPLAQEAPLPFDSTSFRA
ncbi:hypothetical protein D3C79_958010 [compost metagenome]